MELNQKKIEISKRVVNTLISVLVAGFLIALSNNIIGDLDEISEAPNYFEFEDEEEEQIAREKEFALNDFKQQVKREKATIDQTIETVNENIESEQSSFDNWLQTRSVVGAPRENAAVRARAKKLDDLYETKAAWQKESLAKQQQLDSIQAVANEIRAEITASQQIKQQKYDNALRKYELKVFLSRLLFVFPILMIGIFFIIKFRKNKYWPIYLGFVLFSFYAFFFGLLPYLPSYGGYVRYGVGIILSIALGIYAINKFRAYMDRKRAELKISTEERTKNVAIETAEKAMNNHVCPSCGKDFILKAWDAALKTITGETKAEKVSHFCRFCGIQLFKSCSNCGEMNYAHLPYCTKCGTRQTDQIENLK